MTHAMPSLLSGLIEYVPLTETGSTRASLLTGDAYTVAGGSIASAGGPIASATDFVSARITRTSNTDLVMGDVSFTLAGWARMDTISGQRGILGKDNGVTREYIVFHDSANLGLSLHFGALGFFIAVPGMSTAGLWYHFCVWHDAVNDLVGGSINDAADTSIATGGTAPPTGSTALAIGSYEVGGTGAWDGQLAEIGIWKRLLTRGERSYLYNGGLGRTFPFVGRSARWVRRERGQMRRSRDTWTVTP